MIHGTYYFGSCRNASTARWDANKNCFTYWRYKFGDAFTEDINHIDDDDGFDCFEPFEIVDWGTDSIPISSETEQ